MVLSEEDLILIKNLYYFKSYGAKRLISEFLAKGWKKTIVNDFLKCLKETGSTMQKSGSRRPRTVRTWWISAQSMTLFSVRKTHLRYIVQHDRLREKWASILRDELRLKCVKKCHAQELTEANCITRLSCVKKLLSKFIMLITEMFCYCTRCFLQSDIWQAMCLCSSRIVHRSIMHVPQSSICTRLHPNSYHLTYGHLTALTLTQLIIRFGVVFRNACTRSPYVTWIS